MMSQRQFVVTRREAGQTLAAFLRAQLRLSWNETKRLIGRGQVRIGTTLCTDPAHRVKSGHRLNVAVDTPARSEQRGTSQPKPSREIDKPSDADAGPIRVVYADTQIVVVEKPAGLTTMRHASEAAEFGRRAQRYLPTTLLDLLEQQLAKQTKGRVKLRAVHRLDKDTSGLVVFARTPESERHLGLQFRAHSVGRTYLAVVRGRARPGRIESTIVRDRGDGRRGSSPSAQDGKRAVTHVSVVEELGSPSPSMEEGRGGGDFTLVECRLETGRTHQVRIHLGERGTPICGETVYDRPLHGAPLPDESGAGRLALHAASLAVQHPGTGKRMSWTSALPKDMDELLLRLRRSSG